MTETKNNNDTPERTSIRWFANPIYARLIRADRPFSVRAAVTLAVSVGVASLVSNGLFLWQELAGPDLPDLIGIMAVLAAATGWFCLVIGPPALTFTAASQTAADTRGEAFQLVRLTGLSQAQIATGYLLAALHRRRLLVVLMLALIPSAVLGMMGISLTGEFCYGCPGVPYEMVNVLGLLAMIAFFVGGFLALSVTGASFGVLLGMRQVSAPVWMAAAGMMFFVSQAGVIAMLTLIGPFLGGVRFSFYGYAERDLAISAAICCMLPMLLAGASWWWLMRDAPSKEQNSHSH